MGALITMALPAGTPSERATWSETTASTPSMPTVPSPPTRRFSCLAPLACTVPPAFSLSSWPMVYETDTAPEATFCQSLSEAAVCLAA